MKTIKIMIFIVWVVAITVSSVIPYAKNDGMLSLKLTESGMVVHFMAYFVAAALFYWAYGKKEDSGRRTPWRRDQRSEARGQRSEVRSQSTEIRVERVEGQGLRKEVFFIFLAGLLIFLYSIVLEIVQFYLPYRSFNPIDIVANGFGILFFIISWAVFWKSRDTRSAKSEVKS